MNPEYFTRCDAMVHFCADRGLYAMWAGKTAGTMNTYTAEQLYAVGLALGQHFRGVKNVILCAGGEALPHYIEEDRVNAIGRGIKAGGGDENLVTVHPVSENSTSKYYAAAPWLDFYMSQAKSGNAAKNTARDAASLVLGDWSIGAVKPTMMGEHRYESGTDEDPLIQRRSL